MQNQVQQRVTTEKISSETSRVQAMFDPLNNQKFDSESTASVQHTGKNTGIKMLDDLYILLFKYWTRVTFCKFDLISLILNTFSARQ